MTIRRDSPRVLPLQLFSDRAGAEYGFNDGSTAMYEEWLSWIIDRRTLLKGIAAMLAATVIPSPAHAGTTASPTAKKKAAVSAEDEPWPTFAAVHEHLFPGDDEVPGAGEIHATAWLKSVLMDADTDPEVSQFILDGVSWLNDISRKTYELAFVELDAAQREAMLRQIEQSSAGKRWLSLLLLYLFEALLGDPVYGGNPGGIGWKWLDHRPGFPLPTAQYTYRELKKL